MESIESLMKLLNSYPLWAKACAIGGVLFSLLILIFAPRNDTAAQATTTSKPAVSAQKDPQPILLRINGVKLFPEDPSVEIQVLAIVNETRYEHPSVGGIKWMKVGPDMSPKLIELPRAPEYQVRFEMWLRNGSSLSSTQRKSLASEPAMRAASQLVDRIRQLPFSEEYKLYDVDDHTRGASVRAVISYSISEGR